MKKNKIPYFKRTNFSNIIQLESTTQESFTLHYEISNIARLWICANADLSIVKYMNTMYLTYTMHY
ncbi:hypothetical protein L1275_002665 [Flavobacterium sp. HSC-61S13]|nr:hypothetical protein [Flavobacterium sp. HSC-61S13]